MVVIGSPLSSHSSRAFDAVVLEGGIDVGPGRGLELLGGLGDEDVAVLVVHLPVVVAVERRQVDEELAVEVVDAVAVEPDAAGVGAVGDRVRAERPDVVAGRVAGDGDAVAGGLGAAAQRAVLGRDLLGERTVEEQADVETIGRVACGFGRRGRGVRCRCLC